MSNKVKIEKIGNGKLAVIFPYHEDAKTRIKNLNGRWDGSAWVIPEGFEQSARDILMEVFGTDGTVSPKLIRVRVIAKQDVKEQHAPVECCGKVLARAWGRDSGAQVGDDVALIKGHIRSGGSMKNWLSIVKEGAEFDLLNVFPKLVDGYDSDYFSVEILEDKADAAPDNEYNLDKVPDEVLLAEVRARGLLE